MDGPMARCIDNFWHIPSVKMFLLALDVIPKPPDV
jgi:hypothetical protein